MASSRPASSTTRSRPVGRRLLLRWLGWLAVIALGVALALHGQTLAAYARTATAYGARIGCSCHYVAGRPLGDCRDDFVGGMALVTLSDDEAARSVTARFALFFPQTATFQEGAGCQLETWRRN